MSNSIVDFVVRNEGRINQEASQAKFAQYLTEVQSQLETSRESVSSAVHQVFDKYRGTAINTQALCSAVSNVLGLELSAVTKPVGDYIRANSGEGGLFTVRKGFGGGIRRVSDIPAEVPEAK